MAGNNTELKRLRYEIENLKNDLADQTERGDRGAIDCHRLRAELADARELLREAIPHAWGNGALNWVERANALLERAGDCKP
jgi:hypothetical protein